MPGLNDSVELDRNPALDVVGLDAALAPVGAVDRLLSVVPTPDSTSDEDAVVLLFLRWLEELECPWLYVLGVHLFRDVEGHRDAELVSLGQSSHGKAWQDRSSLGGRVGPGIRADFDRGEDGRLELVDVGRLVAEASSPDGDWVEAVDLDEPEPKPETGLIVLSPTWTVPGLKNSDDGEVTSTQRGQSS